MKIIDGKTKNYIKSILTILIKSRSFSDYITKTIFNNLENYGKNVIKILCETQSNKTND